MSDQSKVEKSFGIAWPFASPHAAESVQVQMQALLKDQADLLNEIQKAMAGWMKRRQEMAEAGFRTFQAMCACKDPAAFAAAYGEWLTNSMSGILVDINTARDEAQRLAQIGQNSATALFRHGADVPSTTTIAVSPSAPESESTRTKGASRTPRAHEHSAAE
jgi:hypothetical protein